ncbi:non-ribosomal peptide synthetase [Rhodococcoides yunnanense]|uniref:non-ribosomal peptide synthetase n=1 Tax=Rhodococcoides yunnanense TaxID=278209 RepID=UPI000933851C|nr:non-ribosomal peptide synthetase [Rhodococcus yunnanensis]
MDPTVAFDEARRAALTRALAQRGLTDRRSEHSAALAELPVGDDGVGVAPLSPEQQRMYFAQCLNPTSAAYNVPFVLILHGDVNADHLADAVGDVVARHDVLRTTYTADADGVVRQHVMPTLKARVGHRDVDADSLGERAFVDNVAHAQMVSPFNLQTDAPLRAVVVSGSTLTALVIVIHHIAFDAGSHAQFFGDLGCAYRIRSGNGDQFPPALAPYWEYALASNRPGQSAATLEYWRGLLPRIADRSVIPWAARTGDAHDDSGTLELRALPTGLSQALESIASARSCPPLVLLWAASALALRHFGSGDQFALGMPVSTRPGSRFKDTIGVFVNTIPLPTNLSTDRTLGELITELTEEYRDHIAHSDAEFDVLVRDIAGPRSHPLLEVMVNTTTPVAIDLGIAGVRAESAPPLHMSAPFPLTFGIYRTQDDHLGVSLLFRNSVVDKTSARRILGTVIGNLAQLAFHSDLPIHSVIAFDEAPTGENAPTVTPTPVTVDLDGIDSGVDPLAKALAAVAATFSGADSPELLGSPLAGADDTRLWCMLPSTVVGSETSEVLRQGLVSGAPWQGPTSIATRDSAQSGDAAIVDVAEDWLDIFDLAKEVATDISAQPRTGSAEISADSRTAFLSALHELVLGSLMDAVATHATGTTESPLWFVLDEPDRDSPDDWMVLAPMRRRSPVLVFADGSIPSLPAPRSYGWVRDLSPHTVGMLDDCAEPPTELHVFVGTFPPNLSSQTISRCVVSHSNDRWRIDFQLTGSLALVDPNLWAEAFVRRASTLPNHSQTMQPTQEPLVAIGPFEREQLTERYGPLDDVWPLTPLQEGLAVHLFTASSGGADVYATQNVIDIVGDLDPVRLEDAANRAIATYPSVRAAFAQLGTDLVQVIVRGASVRVDVHEIAGDGAAANEVFEEHLRRPFDAGSPPLMRIAAVCIARPTGQLWRVAFTIHHILLDGWSGGLFLRAILDAYTELDTHTDTSDASPSALGQSATDQVIPAEPFPMRTYHAWLAKQDRAGAADTFAEALRDVPGPTTVAPGYDTRNIDPLTASEFEYRLDATVTSQVHEQARRRSASVNTLFELAWATTLMRVLGADDVCFGTVISGRPSDLDGIDRAVGLVFNTVTTRLSGSGWTTINDACAHLHSDKAAQLRRPYVSLTDLVDRGVPPQLFDTLFVYQNHPKMAANATFGLHDHLTVADTALRDATNFPLTVALDDRDGTITVRVMHHHTALSVDRARTIISEFDTVLVALASGHVETLADLTGTNALLPDNAHGTNLTGEQLDATVWDLLERRAVLARDEIAVVAENRAVTFSELREIALTIGALLTARGAGPESRIGILMRRDELTVAALFGVFAVHAAYVPVDEKHPPERIADILDGARPDIVLVSPDLNHLLPERFKSITVPIDRATVRAARIAHANNTMIVRSPSERHTAWLDHTAYVIFTSGSTGRPKGVQVPYRGLTSMYYNHEREIFTPVLAAREAHRGPLTVAHTTALSFDASWEQLFWLLHGQQVHIVDDDLRRDPQRLMAYFRKHDVDACDLTPSYATVLTEHGLFDRNEATGWQGLSFLSLGGEGVPAALWSTIRSTPGLASYNLYGPTEYTINAVGADLDEFALPCIGHPIANTTALVLNSSLHPVAPDAAGELYLAGAGMVRGYFDRPDLSAERFVADPFGPPGRRMYRTGDLVRWNQSGGLDYLGRTDAQVKIRGNRVEPGEIADMIRRHPQVRGAAVIARNSAQGAIQLVGYTIVDDAEVDTESIRDFLANRLPAYMVPEALVVVAELPLTVNGKLDVAALPAPQFQSRRRGGPPQGEAEAAVAEVFADLLGADADSIGRDDDFFALGGHSLLAVRLAARAATALGRQIDLRSIYGGSTVAEIASTGSAAVDRVLVEINSGSTTHPTVVCLHPAGGSSWPFFGLRRHLPQAWNMLALQDPVFSGGRPVTTATGLVDQYTDELVVYCAARDIREVTLLGWSFGGQLAYSMINALCSRGVSVSGLVLLDTYLQSEIGVPAETDEAILDAAAEFFGTAADSSGPLSTADSTMAQAMREAYLRHSRMMEEPVPLTDPVPTQLIVASDTPGITEDLQLKNRHCWQNRVGDHLHVQNTPLAHNHMTTPEGWAVIAPLLHDFVRDTARRPSNTEGQR